MQGFSLVPREGKKPRGWSGVVTQEKSSILIGQGSRGSSEGLSKNMAVNSEEFTPSAKVKISSISETTIEVWNITHL